MMEYKTNVFFMLNIQNEKIYGTQSIKETARERDKERVREIERERTMYSFQAKASLLFLANWLIGFWLDITQLENNRQMTMHPTTNQQNKTEKLLSQKFEIIIKP